MNTELFEIDRLTDERSEHIPEQDITPPCKKYHSHEGRRFQGGLDLKDNLKEMTRSLRESVGNISGTLWRM